MSNRAGRIAMAVTLAAFFLSGCDWTMTRYDTSQNAFSPFESTIGAANVGTLHTVWSATLPAGEAHGLVEANGTLFVGTDASPAPLYAFDANGVQNCSGVPSTCTPLWTSTFNIAGTPEVANGRVYVPNGQAMFAFDANGVTSCSGAPKTCAPVLTFLAGGRGFGEPVISNGIAYVGVTGGGVAAFDANGVNGCTPGSGSATYCSPLWIGETGNSALPSSPSVVNGFVYATAAGTTGPAGLFAFDRAGVVGCAGSPLTCTPLWHAAGEFGTPVVADAKVYVASGIDQSVKAFDANGTGCTGQPATCTPLWVDATGLQNVSDPTVANGIVYTVAGNTTLEAFDAKGSMSCEGTPKTCVPIWTAPAGASTSPIVANGVVYVGWNAGAIAYDAAGVTNCYGQPETCAQLSQIPLNGYPSLIIANGMMYGSPGKSTSIAALAP